MALSLPAHGGNLAAAAARWGSPPDGWIDLSTGVNPWPYPVGSISGEVWARLPSQGDDRALRHAAARAYGVPGPDWVLPAPGSSPLIRWLAQMTPRCRVAVLGPTYSEHAEAWTAAGHDTRVVADLEGAAGADVVVVVNPNNPDGRRIVPERLVGLGGLVVVDEAFGEVAPELTVARYLRPGMVVLRSFGKFYGLAGLRLGFALAPPDMVARLEQALGPWAVSGPALVVGARALADGAWADATRAHLASMAQRLDAVLAQAGMEAAGGTALFRFVSDARAPELYERLGRSGILVRAFADRPRVLRIGLPSSEGDLQRLAAALR
ncbi:MAG: threonine-phosphate decarboxylase CobD [Solirubrobacterales bacterium]